MMAAARAARGEAAAARTLGFRTALAALVLPGLILPLAGCVTAEQPARPAGSPAAGSSEAGSSEAAEAPEAPEAPEAAEPEAGPAAPEPVPEAEAVRAQLTELAAQAPAPSRDAVRDAYAAAGFSPAVIEVSQDTTPTGLAVDSIVAAAPFGEECVLGEIRSGSVSVTVVPVLAGGQCLLGDDR